MRRREVCQLRTKRERDKKTRLLALSSKFDGGDNDGVGGGSGENDSNAAPRSSVVLSGQSIFRGERQKSPFISTEIIIIVVVVVVHVRSSWKLLLSSTDDDDVGSGGGDSVLSPPAGMRSL